MSVFGSGTDVIRVSLFGRGRSVDAYILSITTVSGRSLAGASPCPPGRRGWRRRLRQPQEHGREHPRLTPPDSDTGTLYIYILRPYISPAREWWPIIP